MQAMKEMTEAGLPITEFSGVKDDDNEAEFLFSRGLTPAEQQQAQEIVSKYMDVEWVFTAA